MPVEVIAHKFKGSSDVVRAFVYETQSGWYLAHLKKRDEKLLRDWLTFSRITFGAQKLVNCNPSNLELHQELRDAQNTEAGAYKDVVLSAIEGQFSFPEEIVENKDVILCIDKALRWLPLLGCEKP